MSNKSTFRMVLTALLSAISFALFFLEFPLLPAAPYLKMDFSDLPALLAGILLGPAAGIAVELIKNLLGMAVNGLGSTMGIGNLQNFLVGISYVIPFSLLFRSIAGKNKSTAVQMTVSLSAATLSMVVIGFLSNLIITPLYFKLFGFEFPGGVMAAAVIATVFNLIKCGLLAIVMIPVVVFMLKPLKSIIDKVK